MGLQKKKKHESERELTTVADSGPISWYRAARSQRECACALCWSPWRGLGAKTRLSRLVLNFLPSAPALYGLPSLPCRALGGGRIGEVGGLAELSALTDRTLLPNPPFLPLASSHHLLTRQVPERLRAPAPRRSQALLAPSAPCQGSSSGPFLARPTIPRPGQGWRAPGRQAGEGGGWGS